MRVSAIVALVGLLGTAALNAQESKQPLLGLKKPPPADVSKESPGKKSPPPGQTEFLRAVFKRLDRDGNGQLSYEEFAAGAASWWRGRHGPSPLGVPGFGPPAFAPPRFHAPAFGPPMFGPRPTRPSGPPWFGPAAFARPRPAWWHRGVWPGMRQAMLPALVFPRGPLGGPLGGLWARFGRAGATRFDSHWHTGPWHPGPPPWAGGGAMGLMARFDADHDGRLSRTEAPPRLAERFDTLDRNGDGFLTRDELYAAAQKAPRGRKPAVWGPEKPPKLQAPQKPKDKPFPEKPPKGP